MKARHLSSNALSCENPSSFEMEDPKLRMPLKTFSLKINQQGRCILKIILGDT